MGLVGKTCESVGLTPDLHTQKNDFTSVGKGRADVDVRAMGLADVLSGGFEGIERSELTPMER